MLPFALLAICCVTSWTEAVLPSVGQTENDLRATVVFNQLALAEVLESLRNMSHGELATTSHLDQLARRQDAQLRDLVRGLADINSNVDILSQSLTSHLQQDIFLERDSAAAAQLMETLKAQAKALRDLDRENNQTTAAIRQLGIEVAGVQEQTGLYEREILQLQERIRAARRTVEQLGLENRELWTKANSTEGQTDALRSRIEALKDQEDEGNEALARSEEKTSLEQEVAALENTKSRLQQEVTRLQEENAQETPRLRAAQAQRDELSTQNAKLKASIAQATAERQKYQASQVQVQQSLARLEAETSSLKAKQRQADQENANEQKKIPGLEQEKKRLQREHEISNTNMLTGACF
ncbi:myosin-11-like [Penaeus monodon]|uniref:myosin-11-like n=1 Tax=Penaeus monodon TaxID=6687 RepID=UPI0018A6D7FB|nr:myosin-11-like [Penaeus monodon]